MKKVLQTLVLGAFMLTLTAYGAYAQTGSVKGSITDSSNGEPLIGANVVVKGTTTGAVTDVEGSFLIENVSVGSKVIVVSFVGYDAKEFTAKITEGQTTDLGTLQLEGGAIGLEQVMVIASVAVDRKTPVAVSTIKQAELESKIGSQEFPEILKSTPGIYATKQGGGFGDGRVNIRGFNDENVAVLINGVPVNDMENGNVYWSNWVGLTDATNSMQVQRGLGASKVAVPSIGGTINIISKASEMEKGGNVYVGAGNDKYSKIGFSLSSGLSENGWAFTINGSKTEGNGYVDGTEFLGYSYYANIAKQINDHHEITLTAIGAPQRHGQRQTSMTLDNYEGSPSGIKYNADWGYLNGQVVQVEDNFYHKPQLSLNHYWTISDRTDISTAIYASYGTGGGGGKGDNFNDIATRTGGEYGPYDIDEIVAANEGTVDGNALTWLRASRNDHKWYGMLSTLNHQLSDNLTLLAGLDLRTYTGSHFYEITDLLGADYVLNDDNHGIEQALGVGDKYNYNYDGKVGWGGLFGQLEYSKDKLSAFISLAASNTTYRQIEYFNEADQESDAVNFFGYQVKGGANYNLDANNNIYANIGTFSKAPFYRNVFTSRTSNIANTGAKNEDIFSAEIGYGFRKPNLIANVNLYRTQWNNRAYQFSTVVNEETFYANAGGINALHQGLEIDAKYTLTQNLTITGMASLGDWTWMNNVSNIIIEDENNQPIGDPVDLFIEGLRVGDAAQTTAALGINYTLMEGLSFGVDYNYFDNLYASFDPINRTSAEDNVDSWQVPAYGLFDLNMTYNFDIGGFDASLYGNIYNIADTEYVADANDGSNHDAFTSNVYYGFGRTWNLGLKVRF